MMKRLVATGALATLMMGGVAFAADQTWTGKIGDSMCGATHKAMQEHKKDLTDRACTEACIKGGGKYILSTGGKVYTIDNQQDPALAMYAGEEVTVTGEL